MADRTRAAQETKKIEETLRTLKEGNERNAKEIGKIRSSLKDLGGYQGIDCWHEYEV